MNDGIDSGQKAAGSGLADRVSETKRLCQIRSITDLLKRSFAGS